MGFFSNGHYEEKLAPKVELPQRSVLNDLKILDKLNEVMDMLHEITTRVNNLENVAKDVRNSSIEELKQEKKELKLEVRGKALFIETLLEQVLLSGHAINMRPVDIEERDNDDKDITQEDGESRGAFLRRKYKLKSLARAQG